jgi:hypothetical protein
MTLHGIRSLSHIIHRVSENQLTIKWNETNTQAKNLIKTLMSSLKDAC